MTGQPAEERHRKGPEKPSGPHAQPALPPVLPPKFAHRSPSPLTSLVPAFVVFTRVTPVATCLVSQPYSCTPSTIANLVARVSFYKHKSNHLPPLPKTFSGCHWSSG